MTKPNPHRHQRDVFGVTTLSAQHPQIRRLKKRHQTSLHGNKSWAANYLLMDYLRQHPPTVGARVMDVGCGWGLAGILCARYASANVLAVDADTQVFPYLELVASCNDVSIDTRARSFEQISTEELNGFDYLIAADICFWDDLADVVYKLVDRACAAGVAKIIIADPQRPPFWDMAERCVETFYAEVLPWRIQEPRRCSGAIMIIENS